MSAPDHDLNMIALQLREWAEALEERLPRDSESKAAMLGILSGMYEVANDLSPRRVSTCIRLRREYSEDAEFVNGRSEATPMHRWWAQVADEFNDVGQEWMPEGQSCVQCLGVSTKMLGNAWFVYFDMEVTLLEQREGDPVFDRVEHLFFRDGGVAGSFVVSPLTPTQEKKS